LDASDGQRLTGDLSVLGIFLIRAFASGHDLLDSRPDAARQMENRKILYFSVA
jgi:hypothetical protein